MDEAMESVQGLAGTDGKVVCSFSEDEFVDFCTRNARRNTSIFRDIYEAVAHFFMATVWSSLPATKIRDRYPVGNSGGLSLRDYQDKGFIDFWYPEFDIWSKKEDSLDMAEVVFPPFIKLIFNTCTELHPPNPL